MDIKFNDFMDIVYCLTKIKLIDCYSGKFIKYITPNEWFTNKQHYEHLYVYAVVVGTDGLEVEVG